MNVSELKDAKLDFWVAKANGEEVLIAANMAQILYRVEDGIECYQVYSPSTDWTISGPIIHREGIGLEAMTDWREDGAYGQIWEAHALSFGYICGDTPIIAAMRAYVASKFGAEVDDSQAGEQ